MKSNAIESVKGFCGSNYFSSANQFLVFKSRLPRVGSNLNLFTALSVQDNVSHCVEIYLKLDFSFNIFLICDINVDRNQYL